MYNIITILYLTEPDQILAQLKTLYIVKIQIPNLTSNSNSNSNITTTHHYISAQLQYTIIHSNSNNWLSAHHKQQEMNNIQFYSWRSQLPQLHKIRDKCMYQIAKIIVINAPENCDQKIFQIKNKIENDFSSFCYEEYYDVFAYLVEERVNYSLEGLAILFVGYFGLDEEYWSSKITQIASFQYFSAKLMIWHVREQYQKHLNYQQSPDQVGRIRSYRKIARSFLSALQCLISKLQKLKITDTTDSVQSCYQRFHKQKAKYQTYIHKQSLPIELEEDTNVSMRRRQEAESKLYNFPQAAKTMNDFMPLRKEKLFNNTLMNYKFNLDKQANKKGSKIMQADQLRNKSSQQYRRLHSFFQNLSKEPENDNSLEVLRKRFKSDIQAENDFSLNKKDSNLSVGSILQVKDQQSSSFSKSSQKYSFKLERKSDMHFTSIWNQNYFFFYEGCPFTQKRQINYTQPFQRYEDINYEIDSQMQFDDIDGQEISSNQEMSQCDELNESQLKSLINDQPDQDPQGALIKFQVNLVFGKKWHYDYRYDQYQEVSKYSILQIHTDTQILDIQVTEAQINKKKQKRKNSRANKSKMTNQSKLIEVEGSNENSTNKASKKKDNNYEYQDGEVLIQGQKLDKFEQDQETRQIQMLNSVQETTNQTQKNAKINNFRQNLCQIKEQTVQSSKVNDENNKKKNIQTQLQGEYQQQNQTMRTITTTLTLPFNFKNHKNQNIDNSKNNQIPENSKSRSKSKGKNKGKKSRQINNKDLNLENIQKTRNMTKIYNKKLQQKPSKKQEDDNK